MKNSNIGKKIFVLLIALVFFGSIIYVGVKDTKIIKEEREKNEAEWKEEEISEQIVENEDLKNEETKNKIETQLNNRKEAKEDILGVLKIKKINLEAKVKEGSSQEILEDYIGHIEGTAIFEGNVGLAAHNRGEKNNYFENLDQLSVGDEIIYKVEEKIRKYKVYKILEILDTDWTNFENTEDNQMTLITCVNNKVNVRLCVKAKEEI